MNLAEIKYSTRQELFFEHLAEISSVLDTVILNVDGLPDDIYLLSKQAAIKGMEILSDRCAKRLLNIENKNSEGHFSIQINPNEDLSGTEIDFYDFIGPGYDFVKQAVNLFTYDLNRKTKYDNVEKGFAKALLNPPYSLGFKLSGEPWSEQYKTSETMFFKNLINEYLSIVLNVNIIADTDCLRIISWSDNWTNYFDDGKEWWGTFCWTIYNPGNSTLTLIAASSTD